MTDNVTKCSECGRLIYPPDSRTNIEKAIDMLQDRMRVSSDDPFIKAVRAEYEALKAGVRGKLRFVITHKGEEWIAWPTTPSGVNISSRAALSKENLKPWCNEMAKELHCEAEFVEDSDGKDGS